MSLFFNQITSAPRALPQVIEEDYFEMWAVGDDDTAGKTSAMFQAEHHRQSMGKQSWTNLWGLGKHGRHTMEITMEIMSQSPKRCGTYASWTSGKYEGNIMKVRS